METIAAKLQEALDLGKRNAGRIEKIERDHEALHEMATNIGVMGEQLKNVNQNVRTLTEKVEEIESKPAKRWEAVVEKIIIGFVSAIIGVLTGQLF